MTSSQPQQQNQFDGKIAEIATVNGHEELCLVVI